MVTSSTLIAFDPRRARGLKTPMRERGLSPYRLSMEPWLLKAEVANP